MPIKIDIMKIERREQYKGAVITYAFDISDIQTKLGVSVTSVAWTSADDTVTFGTPLLNANVSSCAVTAVKAGLALVKLTMTTDDLDIPVFYFKLDVLEPKK